MTSLSCATGWAAVVVWTVWLEVAASAGAGFGGSGRDRPFTAAPDDRGAADASDLGNARPLHSPEIHPRLRRRRRPRDSGSRALGGAGSAGPHGRTGRHLARHRG